MTQALARSAGNLHTVAAGSPAASATTHFDALGAEMQMMILWCAVAVAFARFVDFLLGKDGRTYVKNAVVFHPWYWLQSIAPIAILQRAARWFLRVVEIVFGRKFLSMRAYFVSSSTPSLFIPLWMFLNARYNIERPVEFDLHNSNAAVFLALAVVNPPFDFVSFAVTRALARKIANSKTVLPALTYWALDVIASVALATLTYLAVELVFNSIAPKYGRSVWLGHLVAHDYTVFCSASSFVPTILHLCFFSAFLLLSIAECFRRLMSFLLERVDESNDSPLTLLTGVLSAAAAIITAAIKALH